jgi:hypothetical protein
MTNALNASCQGLPASCIGLEACSKVHDMTMHAQEGCCCCHSCCCSCASTPSTWVPVASGTSQSRTASALRPGWAQT